MTKPAKEMSNQELVWQIEGHAHNLNSLYDPRYPEKYRQHVSRVKSYCEEFLRRISK